MNQPQLNPRDGANIPKKEQLSPAEKKMMEEIENLTKSENAAFSVMAQGIAHIAENTANSDALLQDVKDCLVKVMIKFDIDLPKSIKTEMDSGKYSPDDLPGDEEEEEEEEGDPA